MGDLERKHSQRPLPKSSHHVSLFPSFLFRAVQLSTPMEQEAAPREVAGPLQKLPRGGFTRLESGAEKVWETEKQQLWLTMMIAVADPVSVGFQVSKVFSLPDNVSSLFPASVLCHERTKQRREKMVVGIIYPRTQASHALETHVLVIGLGFL